MIKLNASILSQILAVTPHFRHDSEVLSNISEMVKMIKDDTIDAIENQYITAIEAMINTIYSEVSVDNEGLIKLSTSNEKMAVDVVVTSESMSDATKEYMRKLVDTFVLKIPAIKAGVDLTNAIEELQKAPNNKIMSKIENLEETVNSSIAAIEEKKTSITKSVLVFSKNKSKGMPSVIESLRHEERFMLKTGIKAIDDLMGFIKPKKLYWVTALSGGFKSGFMENCTLRMARNNPGLPKIDGKENAILHITFENDTLQIFKRFIDYHQEGIVRFSEKKLSKMQDEEIIDMASELLTPKNDDELAIIVQHIPRRSMDVQGVRNLIKQLNRDGYNICALVLDYCELMKDPVTSTYEKSNDATPILTRKAESLKLLAQDFDIPVISAGQFNRPGEDIVRTGIANKMSSPLYSSLSAAHLAGGFGIKYHVESSIFLYRGEYDGVDLLHMKVDKARDGLAKDDKDNKDKKAKSQYRFIKFKDNMFALSDDPNDAYTDISDVCPDNETNSIINNAFAASEEGIHFDLDEITKRTEMTKEALRNIL